METFFTQHLRGRALGEGETHPQKEWARPPTPHPHPRWGGQDKGRWRTIAMVPGGGERGNEDSLQMKKQATLARHGATVQGQRAEVSFPLDLRSRAETSSLHLSRLWKAERVKAAVSAGLNPRHDRTSDRAPESNSNSISPGAGMQPRDAQHPPPLHSTECAHSQGDGDGDRGWGGGWGASSIEWGRKTLGAVLCYATARSTVTRPAFWSMPVKSQSIVAPSQ